MHRKLTNLEKCAATFALFALSVSAARFVGEESLSALPFWIATIIFCYAFLWYGLADLHEYLDDHFTPPPKGGKTIPKGMVSSFCGCWQTCERAEK